MNDGVETGSVADSEPRQVLDTDRLRLTDLLHSGRTLFIPVLWVVVWTAAAFTLVEGLTNAVIILCLLALYRTYTRRDAVRGPDTTGDNRTDP